MSKKKKTMSRKLQRTLATLFVVVASSAFWLFNNWERVKNDFHPNPNPNANIAKTSKSSQFEGEVGETGDYYTSREGIDKFVVDDFPKVIETTVGQYKGTSSQKKIRVSEIKYTGIDELGRSRDVWATITHDMIALSKGHREEFEPNAEPAGWYRYIWNKTKTRANEWEYTERTCNCITRASNNDKVKIDLGSGKTYKGYMYNRSHLVADSLGGRAFRPNLITGTRMQNVGRNNQKGGMQYIERKVLDYIEDHPDVVVYYHVRPNYTGKELLPRTVTVYAKSSDNVINETVEVFNSAKGYEINYETAWFEEVKEK